MSQTPRRQAALVHETPDQEGERSHSSPVHEHTSLFHEVHETVRRLLQHVVFACLLTLRLYMLPLLYLSHKLTVRDDPWYFATWNIMLRPGRSMANCTQCHGETAGHSVLGRWRTFRDGICAPLRIIRTLYALGQVIGEDPNTLQPMPPPLLHAGPDSAIDVQSEQENLKPLDGDFNGPTLEEPASASQIYHAALLNGNTLDDILAAFETAGLSSPVRTLHSSSPRVQSPARGVASEERLTGPFRRHRYRNSSMRSLVDREHSSPISTGQASIRSPPCCNQIDLPQLPSHESPVDSKHLEPCQGLETPPQKRPEFITSCNIESQPGKEESEKTQTLSNEMKHCPTYLRRHNHSGAAKRPLSGDRRTLTTLQDRGTMSNPALSTSSPTKRARLQRRVNVYKDDDVQQES